MTYLPHFTLITFQYASADFPPDSRYNVTDDVLKDWDKEQEDAFALMCEKELEEYDEQKRCAGTTLKSVVLRLFLSLSEVNIPVGLTFSCSTWRKPGRKGKRILRMGMLAAIMLTTTSGAFVVWTATSTNLDMSRSRLEYQDQTISCVGETTHLFLIRYVNDWLNDDTSSVIAGSQCLSTK